MKGSPTRKRRFAAEDDGAVFSEYALVSALIAVVCVLAVVGIGQGALGLMISACNAVSTAVSGAPGC